MLGNFITRCLLMLFGYAYPAFQCFKTVEKNRVDIEELRFWCQYWIIVALVTVLERITDILICWFPMYCELKLAFILYLWHPKTKGTEYVYETLLRPIIAQHENDIDRKLKEWRARGLDLAIFYSRNCAALGQTAFFQVLQSLSSQSGKFSDNSNKEPGDAKSAPSPTPSINRSTSKISKPEEVQIQQPESQTEYVYVEEDATPISELRSKLRSTSMAAEGRSSDEKIDSPRVRLRRTRQD